MNYRQCAKKTKNNGVCIFSFEFITLKSDTRWRYVTDKGLVPFLFDWDGKVKSLYEGATYSCKTHGGYCTEIIRRNNWKVPKDYPVKIKY